MSKQKTEVLKRIQTYCPDVQITDNADIDEYSKLYILLDVYSINNLQEIKQIKKYCKNIERKNCNIYTITRAAYKNTLLHIYPFFNKEADIDFSKKNKIGTQPEVEEKKMAISKIIQSLLDSCGRF